MKFTIIGSGGCVALPKPLCKCNVCKEAREKGRPYSRYGCSFYLEDANLIIDTPEDIVHSINNSDISQIDTVLFSHLDPDHTLGFRVFEQLRLNWFDVSEGKECTNPINVLAMPHVMTDLNAIQSKYGGFLDYYEDVRNLIKRNEICESTIINGIKITFVRIDTATIFVFEKDNKKVIYAPCDVKPFPDEMIFDNANLMVIGNTIVGDVLKDGYVMTEDNFMRSELFSMSEIEQLRDKHKIESVVITHLEEDWGKSYDDYIELETHYENIKFAYDGMVLEV